jgi:hypothetical protein
MELLPNISLSEDIFTQYIDSSELTPSQNLRMRNLHIAMCVYMSLDSFFALDAASQTSVGRYAGLPVQLPDGYVESWCTRCGRLVRSFGVEITNDINTLCIQCRNGSLDSLFQRLGKAFILWLANYATNIPAPTMPGGFPAHIGPISPVLVVASTTPPNVPTIGGGSSGGGGGGGGGSRVQPPPTVTSVIVNPSSATVTRGGTQQFTAIVSGNVFPVQTVTWSVTGNTAGTSISENGFLTVSSSQNPATLTIRATSIVDSNRSGTALVTVPAPTVNGVTINPASATITRGQTQQFSATVEGVGYPAQTVTWAVAGGINSNINSSGLLTVDSGETATSLTVTATSTANTSISRTATIEVNDKVNVIIPSIDFPTQPHSVFLNNTLSLEVNILNESTISAQPGSQGFSIQWYRNTIASTNGGTAINNRKRQIKE